MVTEARLLTVKNGKGGNKKVGKRKPLENRLTRWKQERRREKHFVFGIDVGDNRSRYTNREEGGVVQGSK